MSGQLQLRRGSTAENDAFTGAVGELTYDTVKKELRIHDGTTQGGIKIPTEQTADYVVDFQVPTAENNYTWYRKYKSGWVEQGGEIVNPNSSGTALITVNMPVEMSNTHYTCLIGSRYDGNDADRFGQTRQSWTTTNFTVAMTSVAYGTNYQYAWWQVSGMAA